MHLLRAHGIFRGLSCQITSEILVRHDLKLSFLLIFQSTSTSKIGSDIVAFESLLVLDCAQAAMLCTAVTTLAHSAAPLRARGTPINSVSFQEYSPFQDDPGKLRPRDINSI